MTKQAAIKQEQETIRQEHAIYKRLYTDLVTMAKDNKSNPLHDTDTDVTGFAMMCQHRLVDLKNSIPFIN